MGSDHEVRAQLKSDETFQHDPILNLVLIHAECIRDASYLAGTIHCHDVKSDAGLAPIDVLRAEIRAGLGNLA